MIEQNLKELLSDSSTFVIGAELVTTRGIIMEEQGHKILELARALAEWDEVHFLDFTDNPGGNPMLLPESLGFDILSRGKNVLINFTCKDLNRNGLESRAWRLASDGFENLLAMSGDYPVGGFQGLAKPVFDIDSMGLLTLLQQMNQGMPVKKGSTTIQLKPTHFHLGGVVSPFKSNENELLPQYFKLEKKISNGLHFLITQIGYDSRKFHELLCYLQDKQLSIPALANIYVLTPRIAQIFNHNEVPGVVVSDELMNLAQQHAKSADKGKYFFQEMAAKQMAIARGLGYRGAYLGGVHKMDDYQKILGIFKSFGANDWKDFAREIQYSPHDSFFLYEKETVTGLNQPGVLNQRFLNTLPTTARIRSRRHLGHLYKTSRKMHDFWFDPDSRGYKLLSRLYQRLEKKHPAVEKVVYEIEKASKVPLFDCRDCGDCSLPDIAYLCPESQCVKNQRNGPCGGTHQSRCELDNGKDCIWARAYDRLKAYHEERDFIERPVIIKDNHLQGTSAWKNTFLKRDHYEKLKYKV